MKRDTTETFELELLTRAFCGGVAAAKEAEIRAPSIRGQLRWWFRVLGGFASLSGKSIEQQEAEIFGSIAGNQGTSSKLAIRVLPIRRKLAQSTSIMGKSQVNNIPEETYLLWPMAQNIRDDQGIPRDNSRAYIPAGTRFDIQVIWWGDKNLWDDILALITVFGHFGALGYRGRRAQGALAFANASPLPLSKVLASFPHHSSRIAIRTLGSQKPAETAKVLASWLRQWREHGQQNRVWHWIDPHNKHLGGSWSSISNPATFKQPGFPYARRDHNEGIKELKGVYPSTDPVIPAGDAGTTYRTALGLPIMQFFSSIGDSNGPAPRSNATVSWSRISGGEGRFASPVILRPYRVNEEHWEALILFIDCYTWNPADPVFLNGTSKKVSLDLFNAMKQSVPWVYPHEKVL